MSNIDNITEKILQRAKEEVQEILDEANAKASSILESNELKTKQEVDSILKEAEKNADALKGRISESSKLKARDISLKSKEEILDKVLTQVKESLKNLSDKDYLEFLKRNLESLSLDDNAVLTVPKDKLELVKRENLGIDISQKDMPSGFLIADDKVLYNFEFNNFVDSIKEELEAQIVSKLFER